jgi:hypothetical protein
MLGIFPSRQTEAQTTDMLRIVTMIVQSVSIVTVTSGLDFSVFVYAATFLLSLEAIQKIYIAIRAVVNLIWIWLR